MDDNIPPSDEVAQHDAEHMGDDNHVYAGWSITVGELRRAIESVPDDYEVMLENAEVDDIDICNVNINRIYPPALGAPGLLILGGGQILNTEYAYDERMDAHHAVGGDKFWRDVDSGWVDR